jgi:hypothetical protein
LIRSFVIPEVPSEDGIDDADSTTNQSFLAFPVDDAPSIASAESRTSPPYDGNSAVSTGTTTACPEMNLFNGGVDTNCGDVPEGAVTMVGIMEVVNGEVETV